MNIKIEAKQEPGLQGRTSKIKSDTEVTPTSNVHIKNGSAASASVILVHSNMHLDNEIDTKTVFQPEHEFFRKITEIKSESELYCTSDVDIKRESLSFASTFVKQCDPDMHRDLHDVITKIEIKEEPLCLEGISSEQKFNPEKVHIEDLHLQIKAEDNTSERDQEFIMPESARLITETAQNYEAGISSTSLDNGCLRQRENDVPCHESSSINTSHGNDVTNTFTVDDKHKGNECKEKWKPLRECYRKAIISGEHSGNKGGKLKKPLKYEKELKFLRTFMPTATPQTSNLQAERIGMLQIAESETSGSGSCDGNFEPMSTSTATFSHSRKRKMPKESVASVLKDYLDKTGPLTSTYPQTDAITTLFLSMAATAKSFPPDLQVLAKKRVMEVIIDCKMEALNRQNFNLSESGPSIEVPVIQSVFENYIAPN